MVVGHCMLAPRRIDPTYVRAQIDALRAAHPEIWNAEDDVLVADMLEAETDLTPLLRMITDRMLEAEHLAIGIDLLMASLQVRLERFNGRGTAMRELALKLMQWADVKKIELPYATLSIRENAPKVIITDENALPDRLCRIKREPNKKLIREHLESGAVALVGAMLSNAEPSLTVRIK